MHTTYPSGGSRTICGTSGYSARVNGQEQGRRKLRRKLDEVNVRTATVLAVAVAVMAGRLRPSGGGMRYELFGIRFE